MSILVQPHYQQNPIWWEGEQFEQNDKISPLVDMTSISLPQGIDRSSYNLGLSEGYQRGYSAAQAEFRQFLEEFSEAVWREIRNFFENAENQLPQIALEIAYKVVQVEVQTNPEIVRRAVTYALEGLKGKRIVVKVNPCDFDRNELNLSLINKEKDGIIIEVVPDETVERGGVVAESEQGILDLQPKTKLDSLKIEVP